MQTLRLSADNDGIACAASIIRAGGLVAFPTETVYGLGGNGLDSSAVQKIFRAKQRPAWDPMIVHVNSRAMLESVVKELPARFDDLFLTFMPGPLTLVVPRSDKLPDEVTAGRHTVGVRFPAHPLAQQLIELSGLPIAAPSANRLGRVSPTTAEHVLSELDGRIEAVLDGGRCDVGVESTVLDLCAAVPVILRPGAVTRENLQRVLGKVAVSSQVIFSERQEGLPSPGMMSQHYAPRTKLVLVDGQEKSLVRAVMNRPNEKVGVLLPNGWNICGVPNFEWGHWGNWPALAARLYAGLHWLDAQKLDLIIAPLPPEEGLGAAIRERLLKAAR